MGPGELKGGPGGPDLGGLRRPGDRATNGRAGKAWAEGRTERPILGGLVGLGESAQGSYIYTRLHR